MSIWAIVVAAGSGSRFGGAKQFEELEGRRVVDWALVASRSVADVVVLVVPADHVEDEVPAADAVVIGGATRSTRGSASPARPGGTASTIPSATDDAASTAQSTTRRSPSCSYCLRPPKRLPAPAATTTAQTFTGTRRWSVPARRSLRQRLVE
ncbi:MAG: NTP transferase domain-containing protein, partial [Actinomycetota bacterium]|nr:NTP transferase domain-containing protein [Actinomycetota bacterium]